MGELGPLQTARGQVLIPGAGWALCAKGFRNDRIAWSYASNARSAVQNRSVTIFTGRLHDGTYWVGEDNGEVRN
jgi:hypothetical protein